MQIETTACKSERSIVKFRGAVMTFCVVRRPYPFSGNSDEISVQLAVGVFIVEYRHSIGTGPDSREFADRMLM